MISSEQALDDFRNFAKNAFLDREVISSVARPLFRTLNGEGAFTKPFELDAIAAVAAFMFSNGDLESLAVQMPAMQFSLTDQLVMADAVRKLLSERDFTHNLFDGDARPQIEAAIEEARKRFA